MEASNQDTKRDCWCVAFGKFVMYYYLNGVWCILYFYDTMKITVKNFTLDIRYPPHADLGNPRILTFWISYFWKSQTSWIIPDLLDALFLKILDRLSILFLCMGIRTISGVVYILLFVVVVFKETRTTRTRELCVLGMIMVTSRCLICEPCHWNGKHMSRMG